MLINRDNIARQTAQNMVEAGIIGPGECQDFISMLKAMTWNDLMVSLLESWQFRENASDPFSFYPVKLEDISSN